METTPTPTTTKSKTAQLTSLLTNDVLSRVERLRLNPTRRLTNRSRGEHLSGKGGTSTEFSDYRNYVAGDDIRYVDWNIFSRLHRPYVRLYQHEEEMHVVVLLDASSSMMFEDKLERAKQLAAAFGIMGLTNVERVSVYSCNHVGKTPVLMPPTTGRPSIKRLLQFLETLEGGGNISVEQSIESVLRLHRGRGIAVVLSDFLTFGSIERSFNMLYSAGLEIFGIQILGPTEIDPEVTGDLRFVDSETGRTLDISSAGDLLGLYHEHRLGLEEYLAQQCRKRSGRFVSLNAADPLHWVLFDLFRRRGWVE